jgi:peptide/nickel transport system substrate-binding protein
VPFDKYHAGKPKIDRFIVHTYRSEEQLLASFKKRSVDAMVGLTKTPDQYVNDGSTRQYGFSMTAAVMTFFRTSGGILSDVKVRQALVRATDADTVIRSLPYPAIPVKEALLRGQLGYDPAYAQTKYDITTARTMLDQQGWVMGKDGIRQKNGERFSITLYAQDNSEYANVARQLQKQWREVGLDLQIILQDGVDFQATLSSAARGYDALLYGISIGKDPDVYVYWDSKNADIRSESRLNFSEYKSPIADAALQAGRTRTDAGLRAVKYQPFLQAWRDDAPAVGLYQPRFLYVSHKKIYGLQEHMINSEVERFTNVHQWMIRVADVPQTKAE